MDIERLKELKNVVVLNSWLSERAKKELTTLIDEAIARQSTTSEEVQRTIEWLEYCEMLYVRQADHVAGIAGYENESAENYRHAQYCQTAIIALQAYQHMTNYDRIMRKMTVEQMAELFVRDETSQDYPDDIPYDSYTTEHTPGYYCFRDDAVKAEIEWLKQEDDA